MRCSPTATSFFHSQKVVLRNTGLLSSAAHAQCSLSNQNDCSRCAATEDCAAVLACAAQPKSGGESVPSRRASRHCVAQNVNSCNLFERIPLLQQKVQLRELRMAPGAARMPREGRGEAPVQHIPSQNPELTVTTRPFRRGGSARRRRRRRRRRPAAPP